jgi:exopolyphosphatase / guanosine-5'-triphosphate,3'-diphosphate pyrophosphatase
MLAAVIDIGSNSVRLVLYQYTGHHAQPIFNDKVTCGLGKGLVAGKSLEEEAKEKTRATLARFRLILEARCPRMVKVVATAAIRESEDGAAFAAELSEILGHPVEILSGMEEATYAAKGVAVSSHLPHGLVVDLGGGSMELARIAPDGVVTPQCSIPKGSLGFADYYAKHGQKKLEVFLKDTLQKACEKTVLPTVYAVGGSFRAIASHQMKATQYPLHIIHDYALSYSALQSILKDMQEGLKKQNKLIGVEARRLEAVVPACMILLALMKHVGAKQVIFSSAGIREGALRLSEKGEVPFDPLLAMMQAIPKVVSNAQYAKALSSWILSLLPCPVSEQRLVQAFCSVSEIATAVHPSYRAEFAFERMLATLGYGMTHSEQVMMALALYHRYRAKLKIEHPALALVDARQRHFAYALGQLADLAYHLSAGCEKLLMRYRVEQEGDQLAVASDSVRDIIPADVVNWCEGISAALKALEKEEE